MIKLEGSEKQVSWAEEIRKDNINYLKKERDIFQKRTDEEEGSDFTSIINEFDRVIDLLEKQPSAKWWIDHKHVGNYSSQRILDNAK